MSDRASVSVNQLLAICMQRMGLTELLISEEDIARHAHEVVQIDSNKVDPQLRPGVYRIVRTVPAPTGITAFSADALRHLDKRTTGKPPTA